MSAQYTPGPLIVERVPIGQRHYLISADTSLTEGAWDDRYFYVSGFFGSHNPHTFAAAPDLLEALEKAWPFLEEYDGMVGDDSRHQVAINAARAAIARAKGEQP